MTLEQLLLFEEATRQPTLVWRGPLVFPPAPHPYQTQLPWQPPLTREYLRADSWGITIAGAPFVPGGSSKHPERVLSWFLDRYAPSFQMQYLDLTAAYGYTHVRLSVGDSMGPKNNGPDKPPGNEQSLAQFIETCLRVKTVSSARDGKPLSPRVMLGSKYFHPKDMQLQQYQDIFGPILEQLFRAKACDEVTPGWEWNLWQIPGDPTVQIYKWVGSEAHKHGVTCWSHMSPHHTWWGADGTDRWGFWNELGPDVDGIDYQGAPDWTIDELQARLIDTLSQFGEQGNRHKLRMDEDIAVLQFDGHPVPGTNAPADEAQGTARGYLACCTADTVKGTNAKIWGYGNGGALPDGWVL